MSMVCRSDSKNIRKVFYADNREVLACSVTYSERNISLNIDVLNKDYCAENKTEVQEAVSAFTASVNGLLGEANLPMLKTN